MLSDYFSQIGKYVFSDHFSLQWSKLVSKTAYGMIGKLSIRQIHECIFMQCPRNPQTQRLNVAYSGA